MNYHLNYLPMHTPKILFFNLIFNVPYWNAQSKCHRILYPFEPSWSFARLSKMVHNCNKLIRIEKRLPLLRISEVSVRLVSLFPCILKSVQPRSSYHLKLKGLKNSDWMMFFVCLEDIEVTAKYPWRILLYSKHCWALLHILHTVSSCRYNLHAIITQMLRSLADIFADIYTMAHLIVV